MARPKAAPRDKKPIETTKAPPEVEALARELIEADHPSLKDAGIVFGFFGDGKKQKRFGKAKKIPEDTRTLLSKPGTQFEIIVSPSHWRRFTDRQRRQAMDELLCSMSYDGKIARIEKPDFKGFRANLLRYGVEGNEELEESFRNIQLILPTLGAAPRAAAMEPAPPATTSPDPVASAPKKVKSKTDGFGNPQPSAGAVLAGRPEPIIKGK